METVAIKANQLRRVYQSAGREVVALKDLDLEIPTGRFIAVKGKSVSGKTTLLNCLGGLDSPTSGEILINGRPIEKMSEMNAPTMARTRYGFQIVSNP